MWHNTTKCPRASTTPAFPILAKIPIKNAPRRLQVLAHNVYFSLNDNSAAAVEKLLSDCRNYLSGHPGTVFFAVGTRTVELNRPVNDRDFDVALAVVFENLAAHDEYQKSQRHLAFIAENKSNWKQVRVFDADAEG
jgi:hypothetical protein